MDKPRGNFDFLADHDAQLARLGALEERYFAEDPGTALFKLRQLAELLAQQVAARMGAYASSDEPFADLLQRLKTDRHLPRETAVLLHQVPIAGNKAVHRDHGPAKRLRKSSGA